MESDRDYGGGQVPLREFGDWDPGPAGPQRRPAARRDGIRLARRMSNWTAAALLVGSGAAAVALAHQALPAAAPPAGSTAAPGAAAGSAAPAAATGPQVAHSVVTTSGSGVTTTTTTRTVHGRVIVTRVRHAPAYQDN